MNLETNFRFFAAKHERVKTIIILDYFTRNATSLIAFDFTYAAIILQDFNLGVLNDISRQNFIWAYRQHLLQVVYST